MLLSIPKIFKSLTRIEKIIALGAFVVFIFALTFFAISYMNEQTTLAPKSGGAYVEGMVGQPVFINPVIPSTDVDRDIISLVYDNLYDLAENITPSENKLIWTVRLKDNIFWHDGERLTSDDVVFTIQTIQDGESRSPLQITWRGVIAERVSELEVKLVTGAPYVFFEDNLKQLYVAPKHIYEDVPAVNWRLSNYNLQPIGSGPYKYLGFKKEKNGFISEYNLTKNKDYFKNPPFLDKITFKFFTDSETAIQSFNSARINGLSGIDPDKLNSVKRLHKVFDLRLPNYYAIFLNQSTNSLLKDKNVRLALNYATPKEKIIKDVFDGFASASTGPLPFSKIQTSDQEIINRYDPEEAINILEQSGVKADASGTRGEINLVVPELEFLVKTAEIIKAGWENIGIKTNVIVLNPSVIMGDIIKTRDYEALIFGNVLSRNPDVLSFWHSSERFYPGLNLSLWSSKSADKLMESVRQNFDENERASDLASLQSLIIQDMPAIFLYSPSYLYILSTKVKGVNELIISDPSQRFQNVEEWHLKTKRDWK